jgi:hypothetical protein
MGRYAANTSVPRSRSIEEIERTLARYGADSFAYGWEGERAVVAFRAHGRMIRLVIPMPERGKSEQAYQAGCRQRYRVLLLVLKAKLEVVESGVSSFEEEFLAYTLLPNGRSVGDMALPEVTRAYETGEVPQFLMPALPAGRKTQP